MTPSFANIALQQLLYFSSSTRNSHRLDANAGTGGLIRSLDIDKSALRTRRRAARR